MSNLTVESFQKNALANRAIIGILGIDLPWVITARNKDERIEKTLDVTLLSSIFYLSPFYLIKPLNKAVAKFVKLEDPNLLKISNHYLNKQKIEADIKQNLKLDQVKSTKPEILTLQASLKEYGISSIKT